MYKDIISKLKNDLSNKRFEHSVRVAKMAEELAARYGVDTKKAYLAGLLHDCAREHTEAELLKYVSQNKLKVKEYELRYPVLLHSEVSAALAKKDFNIMDEEVLDAIRRHTAGGREMSALSKVLFVADFIEAGRKGEMTQIVRTLAQESLDRAVLEKAKFMLEFSKRIKEKLHPDVLGTVEYYKNAR